ncbi:hypothetical protein CJF32_00010162 [Rutstroemia sp. NJR-2017a WRK4]|nr:hypothetical protein CJF32_00010162 [Rutstroemia sp. NJR-2017a WRK4]
MHLSLSSVSSPDARKQAAQTKPSSSDTTRSKPTSRPPPSLNHAPPRSSSAHSSSLATSSSPPDVSQLIDRDAQDLVDKLYKTVDKWNVKARKERKKRGEKTQKRSEKKTEKKTKQETDISELSLEWYPGSKEFKLIGSDKLELKKVERAIAQKAYGKTKVQEKWIFNVRRNAVGANYRLAIQLVESEGAGPITDNAMRVAVAKAFVKQLEALAADKRFRYWKDCDGGKCVFDKHCKKVSKDQGFSIEKGPTVIATEKTKDVSAALDNLIKIDPLFLDSMLAIELSFYLAYRDVMGNIAFNRFWRDTNLGWFALVYPTHLKSWDFETITLKDIKVGQMVYIKGPPSAFTFKPTSIDNGYSVLCSKAGENPLFTGFDSFKERTMTAADFKKRMESKYREPLTNSDIFELHSRSCHKDPEHRPKVSGVTYRDAWAELVKANGSEKVDEALKNAQDMEKKRQKSKCDEWYKSCQPIIKLPKKRLAEESEGCETVTEWF